MVGLVHSEVFTMSISKELKDRIEEELREDLSRYDDEYDVWSEVVLDCPSNTLDEILDEVPGDQLESVYEEVIIPYIRSLEDV
jgi:hypothetical protein